MLKEHFKLFLGLVVIVFILIISRNEVFANVYTGACGSTSAPYSVRYSLDTDTGELIIYANATGDCYMRDFQLNVADEWLQYKNDITSVIISGRVMNIGDYAFRNCTNLTSVSIPNAVIEEIGSYAFYNCKDLVNFKSTQGKVLLPSSVDTIGQYAFNNCFDITQVQMNSNVSTLQNGTFKDCTSMSLISINSAVTYISGMCFRNCSSLTGVSLPSGLTYLGSQAFMDCSG